MLPPQSGASILQTATTISGSPAPHLQFPTAHRAPRATIRPMRLPLLLFAIALASSLPAAEPYPLWDGHESVADYARRTNLPPTKTLDLGSGVKLDLVLIPAGKFIMGTPEPVPVDEEQFQKKIIVGQALLAVCASTLLVMLVVVAIRAIRQRQRPQLSLGRLLFITAAAGGSLLSALHWQRSKQELNLALLEYPAAKARYIVATSDKPGHPVTITKPFYIGKYPVTQEQYWAITGENPSTFRGNYSPVEQVSWDDAQVFCAKVAAQTNQIVRLPTEAEWEFSCRAGTDTTYYSGDTEADLNLVAWYLANSNSSTQPVGQKAPNNFGIYDMHGNVWQWCQDWYTEHAYKISEVMDPQGPSLATYRVLRGGSWRFNALRCRSARRDAFIPIRRGDDIGFRVVVAASMDL